MKPSTIQKITTKPDKIKPKEDDYEVVSLAVMQGNIATLNEEQKAMYDRTRAAYSIVCDTPVKAVAVKKLQALYPQLSLMQAYRDIDYAIKIWNPKNRFDRDFLESILLNTLIDNITDPNSDESARAKNLATFQKYLSSLPQEAIDPTLMQKHDIYIQLNMNGSTINLPYSSLDLISKDNQQYATVLEHEITDVQAEEIMEG